MREFVAAAWGVHCHKPNGSSFPAQEVTMSTTTRKSRTTTRPVTAVLLDLAYMLHATKVVGCRPVESLAPSEPQAETRGGEHVQCARSNFISAG